MRVEYRVEELRIDEPPAAGTFDTTPPAGARLESFESGDPEIVGDLDEAAERLGVALPASTLDPDGYDLVAVGVTRIGSAPAVWVAPRAAGERRVRTRAQPPRTPPCSSTPRASRRTPSRSSPAAPGRRRSTPAGTTSSGTRRSSCTYGLFAGRTAHTWYGADGPAAVVWDDGYAVRVSGGLTRTEAISVLEGLEL